MIQVQPSSFTSAKKFLADTAAGLVFFVAAYVVTPSIQRYLGSSFEGEFKIFVAAVALLLAYPFGLFINAVSFFWLHWLVTAFESLQFNSRLLGGTTKRLHGAAEALAFFGMGKHNDYYQPSRLLEEVDFVFARFGVDSRRTSGIEQFIRNLALIIPIILSMHAFADRKNASTPIIWYILGFFLAAVFLYLAGSISLYRGLRYVSLAYSLNRMFLPEVQKEAEGLGPHERLNFAIRNLASMKIGSSGEQ